MSGSFYSAFAVVERSPHVYFDTATMVLMLFTVGRYLEAAGRARARPWSKAAWRRDIRCGRLPSARWCGCGQGNAFPLMER